MLKIRDEVWCGSDGQVYEGLDIRGTGKISRLEPREREERLAAKPFEFLFISLRKGGRVG